MYINTVISEKKNLYVKYWLLLITFLVGLIIIVGGISFLISVVISASMLSISLKWATLLNCNSIMSQIFSNVNRSIPCFLQIVIQIVQSILYLFYKFSIKIENL